MAPTQTSFLDPHLSGKKPKFRIIIIVITCEYVGALTNAAVTSDGDHDVIIDPGFFSNPRMITNGEGPGGFNKYSRLYYYPFAYLSAE